MIRHRRYSRITEKEKVKTNVGLFKIRNTKYETRDVRFEIYLSKLTHQIIDVKTCILATPTYSI